MNFNEFEQKLSQIAPPALKPKKTKATANNDVLIYMAHKRRYSNEAIGKAMGMKSLYGVTNAIKRVEQAIEIVNELNKVQGGA